MIPVQDPDQSTTKSAAGRERNSKHKAATPADLAECNRRISEIERKLNGHQDEVDSHEVSQRRKKIEAESEKPDGKGPMAGKGQKKGKANTSVEKGPIDDHFKVIDRGV